MFPSGLGGVGHADRPQALAAWTLTDPLSASPQSPLTLRRESCFCQALQHESQTWPGVGAGIALSLALLDAGFPEAGHGSSQCPALSIWLTTLR